MFENHKYWIMGYDPRIDFIIIGEDTGPYSKLPDTNEGMLGHPGRFIYIYDFGRENQSASIDKPVCKCPIIDEMNRRTENEDESFNTFEGVLEGIVDEALEMAKALEEINGRTIH